MRPLTPRRVFAVCSALAAVLLVAVVISLRMGAYPISVHDIVMTLFNAPSAAATRSCRNSSWLYSACDCRASPSGSWWERRFPLPAQGFKHF